MERLGNWLFANQHLKSLSLVGCHLTGGDYPDGKQYLFLGRLKTWLESHKNLEELNLTGNPLNYGTATVIEALRKNQSLKSLILDATYTKDDMFAETFAEDLKANKTLTSFSFRNNKICMYMGGIIDDLKESISLVHVDFTGTDYSAYLSSEIQAVLKRNLANKTK